MFNREVLDLLRFDMDEWLNWFEFVLGIISSENRTNQWRQAGLRGLTVALGVGLVWLLVVRGLGGHMSAPPFRRALRHCALCMSAAAGLGYAAESINAVLYSVVL